MHTPKLDGRVAVVTGAARGIGRGCALELASRGADVVIQDLRHPELAEQVVREIEAMGRRAFFFQGDVADRGRDRQLIEETVSRFGRLDILVNNAAKGTRKPFVDLTVEDVQRTLDVIFWGGFHCTQFAAREMIRQGRGGSVVFISSVHAFRAYPGAADYNAAKAAIEHLARTLAVELAPHRIRVNCIEPGWIDTPGEHETFGDDTIAREGPKLLWGRIGRPEDIAKGVAYLASDDADYVTGTCLRIDGGFVLPNPR